MKQRICMLVNRPYDSLFGRRARSLSKYITEKFDVRISYREKNKTISAFKFLLEIFRTRPALVYLLDIGCATSIAGLIGKILFGVKIILDTGDIAHKFVTQVMGETNFLKLKIIEITERLIWKNSDAIVVRGTFYKQYFKKRGILNVTVIQDGVDIEEMHPMDANNLRRELGLDNILTVGICGSIIWDEKSEMCYGSEIIGVVNILKDVPITGIIIGDGNGLPILKRKVKEYGIKEKILFLGKIEHKELIKYLNIIDICVSTQTDDLIGWIRTTAKLPEYLACGRYILATDVGEASLILPHEMLVPYKGIRDPDYSHRLAQRIKKICKDKSILEKGRLGVKIAKEKFEYKVLSTKLVDVLQSVSGAKCKK